MAVNATSNIEKSTLSTAQCHVRSRCVVSDPALNNEDAGKLVRVELLGRSAASRGQNQPRQNCSFEDLGPAPLQAPPLPLHDVHSASEKGMVQPKAR